MKLSDTFITAAAGLAGAIIGGIATYRANRIQWRRESRRTVYASLIGASYEMEAFIAARLEVAEAAGMNSGIGADLRTKFYMQLDSASLLATWETQGILSGWRKLSDFLDEFDKSNTTYRTVLYDGWKSCRNEFYDHAKKELGSEGRFHYRNALLPYLIIALFFMLISASLGLSGPSGRLTIFELEAIMVGLLVVSAYLLFLGLQASWRWNSSVAGFDGPTAVLSVITRAEISRTLSITTVLQSAIIIALVCDVIAVISYSNLRVSSIITIVGFGVLVLGGGHQLIWGSKALRAPKKE